MPEVPDSLVSKDKDSKEVPELIQWYTIKYRSVILWLSVVLIAVVSTLLVLFPEWRAALANLFAGKPATAVLPASAARTIRFTNLDGQVRVRKANQAQWNMADISVALEKGDTVQTLHNGMARIAFADTALYVVKPDTLIVIEVGPTPNEAKTSSVAVNVTSGVVDLSTYRGSEDSRVMVDNAEARIHQESRALLSNDPETNTRQITVSKGAASVIRAGQRVELGSYEQASFRGADSPIVKSKVVAPPILLTPANKAPAVMTGTQAPEIEFTWNTVPGAKAYRLRVSTSAELSPVLYDRNIQSTSVRLRTFNEGIYYWSVHSIDGSQKESPPGEVNQFSVVRQDDQSELLLQVDKYVQHGNVLEIVGRTEPGATVLINTQPVFSVSADGSFKHFTAPLPSVGPNLITITAQNNKGKVATLRKTITTQ